MKKIITIALACAALSFASCNKESNGDAKCTNNQAKFLTGNSKKATYKILESAEPTDSLVTYNYNRVTENIYKVVRTTIPVKLDIPIPQKNQSLYYMKPCGNNIVVGAEAYDFDKLTVAKNYYNTGTRAVGSSWQYATGADKYLATCIEKNAEVILEKDNGINDTTRGCDKIKIVRNNKDIEYIWWKNDIGTVKLENEFIKMILLSKDY